MLASETLYLAGMATCGGAGLAYAAMAFAPRRRLAGLTDAGTVDLVVADEHPRQVGRFASIAAMAAATLLGLAIATRVAEAHRPPYANLWEYFLVLGFATLVAYLAIEQRTGQRALGAVVLPLVTAELAAGQFLFSSALEPLVPALQNNRLLAIHVACMITAYGALGAGFAASLAYLARGAGIGRDWLPRASLAEDVQDRAIMVGFLVLGLGIVLGAYWGNIAWGRYWGWDPKETTALVSWLVYAAYMHARSLRGWRGKRAAWISVAGFSVILFNIFVVNFVISGLHSYAAP